MFIVLVGKDNDAFGPFKCFDAAELWAKLAFDGYVPWVVQPLHRAK